MATDQEMLARIAQLSSEIQRKKSMLNYQQSHHNHSHIPRGGGSGGSRGSFVRGAGYRGRGGTHITLPNNRQLHRSVSLTHPNQHYSNLSLSAAPGIKSQQLPSTGSPSTTSASSINPSTSYNKILVLNNDSNSATPLSTTNASNPSSPSAENIANAQDGYIVKGRKLIRKDLLNRPSSTPPMGIHSNSHVLQRKTPQSLAKRSFIRGKGPNKVFIRQPDGYVRQGRSGQSLVLNTHKASTLRQKPRYCGFYTRFGRCPNANRCPFVHDPNRKAICPLFLFNRCKKPAHLCKLSHQPNPHIMPHCVYLQKGSCTNDDCPYIHVKVNPKAPVCRAFAMEGYCQKGLDCREKHVHVCPEFADTGKCSNANCRLPHVARRDRNNGAGSAAGVVRLGTWVSTEYFYAQRKAQRDKKDAEKEKKKEEQAARREAIAAKYTWTNPEVEEKRKTEQREKEEAEGFVRLFDDSDDDDGWSQYERNESGDEDLRFNEDDIDQETELGDGESVETNIDVEDRESTSTDGAAMATNESGHSSDRVAENSKYVEERETVGMDLDDALEEGELVDDEGDSNMADPSQPAKNKSEQPTVIIYASVNERDTVAAQQASDDEFFDALDDFAE